LSLLGALLCLFFMFGSNWYYSILVMLLTGAIYKYIEYKGCSFLSLCILYLANVLFAELKKSGVMG